MLFRGDSFSNYPKFTSIWPFSVFHIHALPFENMPWLPIRKKKKNMNQFSQFRWPSTKVLPKEKAGYILKMSQGVREATKEGSTVLCGQFLSLFNIRK